MMDCFIPVCLVWTAPLCLGGGGKVIQPVVRFIGKFYNRYFFLPDKSFYRPAQSPSNGVVIGVRHNSKEMA